MRQVTATEKYRAVNEGKMAKREFVRQMRQSFPQFISQYNGFDDTVQILKNRGMIFEQIKPAFSEAKVYDDRPALTYSLDALDRGIRAELAVLGIDPADAFNIKADDYKKAENKAKDNLEKDANHYLNLMAGESNKVDKHDREKEVKRGALDKDTFNDMKKATLKENMYIDDEEWEKEMGRTPEDTEKAIDKEASKLKERLTEKLSNPTLLAAVKQIKAMHPEVTSGIVDDFIDMHGQDILDGADPMDEFHNYIDANYETASDFREAKGKDLDGEILSYIADTYIQNAKDGDRAYAAFRDLHIGDAVQDVVGILQDPKHPLHGETKKEYQIVSRDKARGLFEKKGKDHDGDGDIDGDDYMAAKDKAIKKAMGKEEQLKEAIKSIIKKTLNEDVINEAATAKLADWGAGYENFEGVKSVVNDLENVVTEVEAFYDKIGDKIAKIFERTAEFKNEEGLNIGAFIAPSLETAFFQDLKPVTKKGFLHKIELPKVKTISQADVQAARERGEIDETPEDPKETIFTPNF